MNRLKWAGWAATIALVATTASWMAATAGGLRCAARDAVSSNQAHAQRAIQALRSAGPSGLDAMFDHHAEVLSRGPSHPRWKQVASAIDQVAAQRDAWASHLYWYTDLDQARAAARAQGKPILSLRLLGKLDEELSCANSRYFRTALYANQEISRLLRDRFVLHWRSVRPAPRITVDYGDGRQVERTITGNSIHYILDVQGRTVDALPGLYGPQVFRRALERAHGAAVGVGAMDENPRSEFLARYHRERLTETDAAKRADESRLGGAMPSEVRAVLAQKIDSPTAIDAGRLAMTKMVSERPLLRQFVAGAEPTAADVSSWDALAQLHLDDARLDAGSLALMRHKLVGAPEALDESRLRLLATTFEASMAEDGLRNQYVLRPRIHRWFLTGSAPADVELLNDRVYADVFLTPARDPWLGLISPDAYVALERQGMQ